jgi:pimeloyl-ACP methyl ester carboxylesterase
VAGSAAAFYFFFLDLPPMKSKAKEAIQHLPRATYEVAPDLGGHLSYLHAGDPDGRRIIFVHGTPGDAEDFGEYLLNVPAGYEYIAVDRPGFGESGPEGPVASLAKQAAALEPLLVQRHGQWPVLVGHSLGGPIVVQTATDYAGKVGGLVILAGALDPAQEHIQMLQRIGEWPLVRPLLPRPIRNANEELIPLKGQLQDLETKLNTLMCPIVIVHGTKDRLVPYANVAFMEDHFRGNHFIRVVTIPDQDHFLPWTNASDVRKAIASVVGMSGEATAIESRGAAR